MPDEKSMQELWYQRLAEGEPGIRRFRHLMRWLPSSPRCKLCPFPFKELGGFLMHLAGRDQSRYPD
jgi:adenylate cyclase